MTHDKTFEKAAGRRCFLRIFLSGILLLSSGCGRKQVGNDHNVQRTTGMEDVLSSAMAEEDGTSRIETVPSFPETTETKETVPPSSSGSSDGVDIDLTELSSTAVFSEVLGMVYEPERYKGKTVKMTGAFSVYYDEASAKYYFACIIQDATACCAQGIEFSLKGDHKYPEDYPEEGAEVTVIGTFDSYEEENYIYLILREASFV